MDQIQPILGLLGYAVGAVFEFLWQIRDLFVVLFLFLVVENTGRTADHLNAIQEMLKEKEAREQRKHREERRPLDPYGIYPENAAPNKEGKIIV
jgi:hypothetical protein